jgi:hypothetical protein
MQIFGPGPENVASYEGLARAMGVSWDLGDISPIHIPDPERYGTFEVVGQTRGDEGLPQTTFQFRYPADAASILERFVRLRCPTDFQVHMGECQDPQDFNGGWRKILVFHEADARSYGTDELGALSPDQTALVNEQVDVSAQEMFHIYRMQYEEQAETEVVNEVVDAVICDIVSCGECGITSRGCDVALFLTKTIGGSPGLPAELVFTQDGGLTYGQTNITTLAANEDPNALACVGANVVVISEDSESLHWAPLADILAGTEVWTEVATGFVVGNGPLAIYSAGPRHTWIVGENGYIYFATDPTAGVVVQDAGIVTAQDLNEVHAFDINHVVAVGALNAVVVTDNAGDTWNLVTGPNVGTALGVIWMTSEDLWWVGDAGGQLWYTLDGGATWTEKTFAGSGAGVVRDLKFANDVVGYMSHDTATPSGRIFRTIDGGNTWYLAPEDNTALPLADTWNALAVCDEGPDSPNTVYAGGLADDGLDGIITKGAGPS